MDAIKEWAMCIMISAAAGAMACAVSPRGATEKVMRAVVGIFVVAAICTPLSQLTADGFDLSVPANVNNDEVKCREVEEYMIEVCKSAAESEIVAAAQKQGLTIKTIFIDAYVDSSNCIIIQNIQVDTDAPDSKTVSDFLKAAEKATGVPVNIRNGIMN